MTRLFAFWILVACLPFYFYRVARGPLIWDRLHGLDLIATKVLLITVLIASFTDTSYILDLAIVCALLGFISVTFTSHFLLDRKKGGGDQ
jgi:multicomponent Na+:H+ antiporter subunit F